MIYQIFPWPSRRKTIFRFFEIFVEKWFAFGGLFELVILEKPMFTLFLLIIYQRASSIYIENERC